MDIGKTIAEMRKNRGISQETLANMLFVSRDLVTKWENGVRRPDYKMIGMIADALGICADDIIGRDEYLFDELEDCINDETDIPQEELTELLNSFLMRLDRAEADVFIKRYYHLMSIAEISSECGIKENHLRSKLSKTRKKLGKFIKEARIRI